MSKKGYTEPFLLNERSPVFTHLKKTQTSTKQTETRMFSGRSIG